MRSGEQHKLIITALFLIVPSTQIVGSGHPTSPLSQTQVNQRHSRENEVEVAHWSAQLKSSNVEERREAAMRLSHLDGDVAASALVAALTDPSPLVRAVVAGSLGQRADPSFVPPLAARLTSDKDGFVRKSAAYALGGFSGGERTAALIAGLNDKDMEVRGAAAVSLGDHPDAAAIKALVAGLFDKSGFVRWEAARALGVNGRGATDAVPALISLLASDHESEVRRQAAAALGAIGDRSALPALERAARDNDPYLTQAARDAIRMIEAGK